MLGLLQATLVGALGLVWCVQGMAQSIYTCVDGKGNRLTSDRPIAACVDREQKELNSSGTTRRKLGPSLTAEERAVEDERERKANLEQLRINDAKRRERALLTRYPNRQTHDKERMLAITQVDEVTATASKRTAELATQRKTLAVEAEFYKVNPSRMPAALQRQIEETEQLYAAQLRFLQGQAGEKQRVNTRFDEELAILIPLWTRLAAPVAGTR